MAEGHLKFIVLKFLVKSHMSGYDLMKSIEEATGWKPSTGSMYPLLDSLRKDRLLEASREGRRTLYSITEEGRKFLDDGLKRKREMLDRMIENWCAFESFAGKGECSFVIEVMKKVREGEVPFKDIHNELLRFRENVFKLHKAGKIARNKDRINKILADVNERLEAV